MKEVFLVSLVTSEENGDLQEMEVDHGWGVEERGRLHPIKQPTGSLEPIKLPSFPERAA